jgi:ribonucleoside-diphosphate reductase alpha chain
MAQEINALIKDEEVLDLASFRWDDQRLSDALSGMNCISTDQAMDISRSLREEIRKRELQTITIPLLERIIEDKLAEYGVTKTQNLKLASSVFVKKRKPRAQRKRKDRSGETLSQKRP